MASAAKKKISLPGRSHRTPFKHFLLNALLGREAGIYGTCPRTVHAKADPWHIIDMNAGDGSDENTLSSPRIINTHVEWVRGRGVDTKVTLIEKATATFSKLVQAFPPAEYREVLHADSRDFRLSCLHKNQAIFVHSDPNSLADWCITPELIETFSETTTMLCTLGCNVGGLKRLPPESRLSWFDHVQRIVEPMPPYHDAVLIALDSDPAQWAYLTRAPLKWTERIMKSAKSGSTGFGLALSLASLRQSGEDFRRLQRELFLTHAERKVS